MLNFFFLVYFKIGSSNSGLSEGILILTSPICYNSNVRYEIFGIKVPTACDNKRHSKTRLTIIVLLVQYQAWHLRFEPDMQLQIWSKFILNWAKACYKSEQHSLF